MKPMHVIAAALAATSLWVVAAESTSKLPAPWVLAGGSPTSYQVGIDNVETVSGKGSKFLRYAQGDGKSWASLGQTVSSQRYLGQRVRFQARVKSRDVSNWAGLWMGVYGKTPASLAFYNSYDQAIAGTTDWQIRSVTLDVPEEAMSISFGVNNAGTGQVWIDDLSLEIVSKDVPVDAPRRGKLPESPTL
ncbi:transcriptional regulator [Rugamonas aquatica]|uniref:Transcriptional regulator n=1 Tax=Rugamonas aquatica TaxID=2743357 RepID=A0A6A7MWJ2_9BURK|nr:transcriptional regulator [Rugamonas aquatica]MQA36868.1 transcriptional regulator [Rugamonas aquatica]